MISEKQKKKITDELADLQEDLRLCSWRITVEWSIDFHPIKYDVVAEVRPNAPYQEAIITIYPRIEKELKNWKQVRSILLHEMIHVILAPLVHAASIRFVDQESFGDSHELVTSHFEKVITNIIDKHVKISK